MRFIFISLLSLSMIVSLAQPRAIFIILDGIPADVIEKVNTPVLDEIAASGGYTRAYVGGAKDSFSQSPTVSAVGYNHLLTSTWSNKHNVWDNDIKEPNYNYWNIFRVVKTAKPELKTAIFSTWTDNRTKLAGESLPAAGNIKLDYSFDGFELDLNRFPHDKETKYISEIDKLVTNEAADYIEKNAPDLSWVYLEFTDDMGHRHGDGPIFYDAVQKADAQVGEIWNAIKKREKETNEKWMIVITTDHGRDVQTGKGHGGQSDRERTTWIATNIKELNERFKQTPAVVDITPSLLQHLGIQPSEEFRQESDGVSFIGKVSISNLKAIKKKNRIQLTWDALNPDGKVEVFLSTTNNFKEGKKDSYQRIGVVAISAGKHSFTSPAKSKFSKILVKAPGNWVNTWIVVE
ncbi:MAG TPA: alkaline phosphatase family protein [Cyclobacteriaceae bacterium]